MKLLELVALLLALSQLAASQELSDCGPSGVEAPQYSIGRHLREPDRLYLEVVVDRQSLRRDSMRALGQALNRRFCKDKIIEATVFDDLRIATDSDPFHFPEVYGSAIRGEYFLDRGAGKENITFSNERWRKFDEFIDLAAGTADTAPRSYTGPYRNQNYRYSVAIPRSLTGTSTVPRQVEGGINISLPSGDGHYIWLGAAENRWQFSRLWIAVMFQRGWIEKEGSQILSRKQNTRYRLGSLKATRLTIRYKPSGSDQVMVKDFLLALRQPRRDEIGTLYRVEMTTSESKYIEDRKVFERVVKSWRT